MSMVCVPGSPGLDQSDCFVSDFIIHVGCLGTASARSQLNLLFVFIGLNIFYFVTNRASPIQRR